MCEAVLFFFLAAPLSVQILDPRPGIGLMPPAVQAWSPDTGPPRKSPESCSRRAVPSGDQQSSPCGSPSLFVCPPVGFICCPCPRHCHPSSPRSPASCRASSQTQSHDIILGAAQYSRFQRLYSLSSGDLHLHCFTNGSRSRAFV